MRSTILQDIKKLLNIDPDDNFYNTDLLVFINSSFLSLSQLGVCKNDFVANDKTTWSDIPFLISDIDSIKSFIYLKVKILFDPPLNSSVLASQKELIKELEFRLNIKSELGNIIKEGG